MPFPPTVAALPQNDPNASRKIACLQIVFGDDAMRRSMGLLLLMLGLVQPANAETNEAYRKAVIEIYSAGDLGRMIVAWCKMRAPDGSQTYDEQLAAWRATWGYDDVQARIREIANPDTLQAKTQPMQDKLAAAFDKKFTDPNLVCGTLPSLLAEFSPDKTHAEAFKIIAANNWGRLDANGVQDYLRENRNAQAPLTLGGQLKPGAYACTQVRVFGENTRTTLNYTLSLYDDKGLRVTDGVGDSNDGTTPYKMRDYMGTYAYQQSNGAIDAESWNYDNYDLRDFAMFQGDYNSVTEERILIIAFRHLTDTTGESFIYGIQEYGGNPERSYTHCRYQGEPLVPSPVAASKAEKAEKEAERFRFRGAPETGLKLEEIAGYLHEQEGYTSTSGYKLRESTRLLLVNGWGYSTPDFSPHDFDAVASQNGEPLRWFKWKEEDGAIQVSEDGANWTPAKGTLARPITPEELTGAFTDMQSYGDMTSTMRFVERTWTFDGSSKFTFLSSARTGAFFDSDNSEGTYTLDGYTLALTYTDGSVARLYAYMLGDGGTIVINGQSYLRP